MFVALLLVVCVSALTSQERSGLAALLLRFSRLGNPIYTEKPWSFPLTTPPPQICTWSFLTCNTQHSIIKFEISNTLSHYYIGNSRALPSEINNLDSLVTIKLNNISLVGDLPTIHLPSLRVFDLSLNKDLTGSLPEFLSSPIESISFVSTAISSSIPTTWGSLTRLSYINLGYSPIAGKIPPQLGDILSLKHLEINTYQGNTQVEGTLPAKLGNLVNLTTLKITSGHISGKIPSSFRNLTNLQVFNLNNNDFEEKFPTVIFSFRSLTYLDLGENNFDGTLPSQLGLLTELQRLNLYDNEFDGPLPAQYGSLSKLRWLRVDETDISGPIPGSYDNLSNNQTGLLDFVVMETDLDCCYPPLLYRRWAEDPVFMGRSDGCSSINPCWAYTPTPTPGVTPTPTPSGDSLLIPEGATVNITVPTNVLNIRNEGTLNVNSTLVVTGNLSLGPSSTININSSSSINVANCASFGGTLTAVLSTDRDTLFNFTCRFGEFETVNFYNQTGLPVSGCVSLSYGDAALVVGVDFSCEDSSSHLIAIIVSCVVVGTVFISAILFLVFFKDRLLPYTKAVSHPSQ